MMAPLPPLPETPRRRVWLSWLPVAVGLLAVAVWALTLAALWVGRGDTAPAETTTLDTIASSPREVDPDTGEFLTGGVVGRVLVHTVDHATLADLRAALVADQARFEQDTGIVSGCAVGMLGYLAEDGTARVLTAADVRAMQGAAPPRPCTLTANGAGKLIGDGNQCCEFDATGAFVCTTGPQ